MIVKELTLIDNHQSKFHHILESSEQPFIWLNWTYFGNQRDQIPQLLLDTYQTFSTPYPTLIIDSTSEAPTAENFDFLTVFKEQYPKVSIIHLTSGLDPEQEKYQVVTDVSTFFWPIKSMWKDSFSCVAQHHFISLARAPKLHRLVFTDEMLSRKLDHYGFYSIGSASDFIINFPMHCEVLNLNKENFPTFPVLLDGIITYDLNQTYGIVDPRITQALVNVVLETSYEKLSDQIEDNNWRVSFITEKTVKPFALGQIPLVLGPQGQVKMIRDLGFDLFDDFIDHSYDLVQDPRERIVQFTNSLEQFIHRHPRESLQSIKDQLMPRFEKNRQLAIDTHGCTKPFEDLTLLINAGLDQRI